MTVNEIVAEIKRGIPLLGLRPLEGEWLTGLLNKLVVAPAAQPAAAAAVVVDYGQTTAPGFEVGPGWLVSMPAPWPNVWVPKNADGSPDFPGLIAAGNPSGPNTGLYGLAYSSMTPADQTAYVAAIKATGAQFT